jgi:hypothetical protein
VKGLDRFKAHFEGCEHQYVMIGGAACDIIMDEVGLAFRATKDLDIVLVVEALDPEFGARFWSFIEAGGYQQRERSGGKKEFYRFQKPSDADFPAMLELFARAPEAIKPADGSVLTPLPIDQDVASLSAILLDEQYYACLLDSRRIVDGVMVLDERLLIPFKAKAYLDLAAGREAGEAIDSRTVKKHRSDVFRLLQLLPAGERVNLPDEVRAELGRFADAVDSDETFSPQDLGLTGDARTWVTRLRSAYGLELAQA